MAFDLSARITADASGLERAADQGAKAFDSLGASAKGAAAGAKALETATESTSRSTAALTDNSKSLAARQTEAMRAVKTVTTATAQQTIERNRAITTATQTAIAEQRLASATSQAERSAAAAALASLRLEKAQQSLSRANGDVTKSANAQQYAIRNVGQQFGDFGLQVAGGTSVARAFGQQAGQLGYALSEMGGRLGAVGKFLTGPWGIALTIGAAVLAPFVESLFKTGEAAKAAELGSTGLASAQSALGEIFDLTTGKLKKQNSELAAANELLRLNARLTAINLRSEALTERASSRKAFDDTGRVSITDRVRGALGSQAGLTGMILGATTGTDQGRTNAGNLNRVVGDLRAGRTTNEQVLRASERLDFTGTGVTREQFQKALLDDVSSQSKTAIADLIDKSLTDEKLVGALRRDGRTKKPPKPKSTAARDEFGRDAADRLATIREQFDTTPPVIANVNKQLRQLDDLIDDLGRRKPPNFQQLIDDANALKPLIENNLTKPFRDYLKAQDEQLAVQRLTSAGRVDEANALRVVQQLQAQMGPLTDQQKDSVLATVQAMRAQQRELDVLREKNAKYLEALGGIKGVVEDATQAFVRGDLGQIIKSPRKLLDAFQTLQGRALFDKLFGGLFRDLEDQVNGTSVVKDASDRMAEAVKSANSSIVSLGDAAANAAQRINGGASGAAGVSTGASLSSLLAQYKGAAGPGANGGYADDAGGTISVVGRYRRDPAAFFERALTGIGTKVAGAFTNPETAKKIGSAFGQYSGKALAGAAEGAAISGIARSLGVKLNGAGSSAGGALGGILGGIKGVTSALGPFGAALTPVLSVVGGLVGNLFTKVKTGSATLGNVGGASAITGTGGNSASLRASSSGLAGGVASNLDSIVSALGGSLGNFSVSIGERKGRFVVDRAGQGRVKTGGTGGVVDSYTTAEEAQAVALRDAILDGAVQGISAAMQAAIRQNSDVNKAVNEALGVKALESRLKGLNGTLAGIFDTEATSAKERLRLAKAYGLDVAAVERDNVQTRTKLIEDTLKSRIGGLSSFLDALKFGDLAEGSPVERLAALSKQIATVQADAEAGKDGAADQLANLLAQKVALSRDSFGTAGAQFSGDRAGAQSAAERVIEMERQRVNEAAGVTTAAQAATTAAVNETNDLIAIQNAKIDTLIATVASLGGVSGATPNYGSVLRTASSL